MRAAIFLYDANEQLLQVRRPVGFARTVEAVPVPLGEGWADTVASTSPLVGYPVTVRDWTQERAKAHG